MNRSALFFTVLLLMPLGLSAQVLSWGENPGEGFYLGTSIGTPNSLCVNAVGIYEGFYGSLSLPVNVLYEIATDATSNTPPSRDRYAAIQLKLGPVMHWEWGYIALSGVGGIGRFYDSESQSVGPYSYFGAAADIKLWIFVLEAGAAWGNVAGNTIPTPLFQLGVLF
jgi:hypothetical protein